MIRRYLLDRRNLAELPHPIPTASAPPGGKIFVFTGIIPIASNDDGLATVIGHGTSASCGNFLP